MQLRPLQVLAREYSAKLLRRSRDGAALVRHYQRWLAEDLLDEPTVTYSLKPYLDAGRLDQDPGLWTDFFGKLPEPRLPDHFEVHCLLGHGVEAVRSAKKRVPRPGPGGECRLAFPRLDESRPDWSLPATACGIRQQSGDWRSMPVTFSGAPANCPLPRSAISSRVAATWPVSATRKEASFWTQSGGALPATGGPLAKLAGACQADVDSLAGRREFTGAVRLADELLGHLARASGHASEVQLRRDEIMTLRGDLIGAARQHFGHMVGKISTGGPAGSVRGLELVRGGVR